jgi:hypothetical protein
MISIIIPTLWKSDMIYKTIESFILSEYNSNSEIIIIDNANSEYKSPNNELIRIIKMEENIYVNPSWNLGVSHSKNAHICLLNDDIFINMNCFLKNFKKLIYNNNLDYGIIAIDPVEFSFKESINSDLDEYKLEKLYHKGTGFGMMMIIKKEKYIDIPNQFKIFFGDDIFWFVYDNIMKYDNYHFDGIKIKGSFSVTSSLYNEYLEKEAEYWDDAIKKIMKEYGNI